ncbi:Transcription-repair coupling factor [Pediococcus damnosus]|uniref:Transcription-repair-coupling factor n=1 Tax=Pediococcus damnosus TaxID=51663 RepID=A0AAC9B211_9LACO|nr:transcription-repair coupling factor [Pediococcus damnosus]AMV60166.1 Transcription-repair coupling factor [Pediococcus damnosus]AMV62686.1 Transcription-repair coupling factor [Pediococcus damnosus]AMV64410.1 Transcription-repair coupling factor [Pediococcus damnosus]AMV67429.1 Transcription-repair coupling factor [Pediococcus damnosus]AMV69729.1 Transcription-repair coupling factor [Pediococcus damnosus]
MNIQDFFAQSHEVQQVLSATNPDSRQLVTGLVGSAKTLLLTELLSHQNAPILTISDNLYHAQQLTDDLQNILEESQVHLFPVEETIAASAATSAPVYRGQRTEFLHALITNEPGIYVTSVSGLRRFLPQKKVMQQAVLEVSVGKEFELTELEDQLVDMGFVREEMVARPGDFAVRGSIVDIYPLNMDYPVRIDFFDTEVDSLRYFDAENQRSVKNIEAVTILPATDFIVTKAMLEKGIENYQKAVKSEKKRLESDNDIQLLDSQAETILARWQDRNVQPEDIVLSDYLYDEKDSLLDYMDETGVLVFDDYSRILEAERDLQDDDAEWVADKLKTHQVISNEKFGFEIRKLIKDHNQAQILLSLFQKGLGRLKLDQLVDIRTRAMQEFYGQMPVLKTEMDRWQKQEQTIVVLIQKKERLDKVSSTLRDFEISAVVARDQEVQPKAVTILQGQLASGFEYPESNLVVITEHELFAKIPKKRPKRQKMENTQRLKSYTELKPGDFVVHVNHGIGRYTGMTTMLVDGVHQDYITIQYAGSGKLFIPVTQLNLVQKYVASEGKHPRLNKLGGSDWSKTKRKVAAKIEDIADELVDLYAQREAEKGYAFSKDDDYQRQFEDDFAYSETPDQLRSVVEIKHDMERPKPMDRLLVGDVGYGKTEVALRAAFKAIEDGKQVAFLVPTTILAQQHYETMINRFSGYPISVGVLSRFRTRPQIKETLDGLQNGTVDIVVGTHRLLSKDVKFQDLGLLIIDEEQRFGVKHKEKIKRLKSDVDVLTLTATPIPRTLNMSMIGVRDLSVIETPPTNRYPIQTYVMEENAGAIRDGIHRELQRGGQVFYLHNRVEDIEETVSQVEALVPEASVTYIHGQMSEKQMEGVLYDFVQGEYDVLVTTTIIETGVDIPNVNTLFVENADHMGLSQLYQLRGRIGRSSRVAYAYFTYKPNKVLTEVSEKRLEAIKDFTELGSGFKIAMRDLSIRGAGNLLGQQQHGFIDSVGYDLYTQMLTDAVNQKQGKKAKVATDSEVELGVEAYLPSTYIEDQRQKIELYKRIRQIENQDQYVEIQEDLIDRFGEYPIEVTNLLAIGQLKMLADEALIEKIQRHDDAIQVTLSPRATGKLQQADIFEALSATKLRAMVNVDGGKMQIKLVIQPKMQEKDWLAQLKEFVEALIKKVA